MLVRFALVVALCWAAGTAHAQEPTVRVRILSREAPRAVTVQADTAPLAVTLDGRSLGTLRPGDEVEITARGSGVEVRGDVRGRGGRVSLAGEGVAVRAGRLDRRYPGSLEVTGAGRGLQIVNAAPLDAYVAGVVAAEYPFPEIEGAKAQAVLARTYALRRAGTGDYDVDDHTGSQVYRGGGTDVSRRAAAETSGVVLMWNGALAEAPYFSSSGGHTADNDAVWNGAALPYLRGVPDPYDAEAPHHEWETVVGRSRLHRVLSARFGGRVTGFSVVRRSRSGRVVEVALDGARRPTISGGQFRRAVNAELGSRTIRSTRFDVRRDGGTYVFTGGGFGHGVGMSQYGARGQARAGRSYRDILGHYFAGTTLGTVGGGPAVATLDRPAPGYGAPVTTAPPVGVRGVEVRRRPTPRREAREEAQQARRPKRRVAW